MMSPTLAALATALLASLAPAQSKRPNIVIIYADDHAQHAIGAYGSRINQTPRIDRLARDGMRFTQSFVGNSICGPARATILTGLHAHAHGQTGNRARFRDDLPTFAKCLQAEGYKTAMIGKWHVSAKPSGFDHWAIKRGGYYNSAFETAAGREKTVGHVTDVITERSIEWMRKSKDEPFAIWISHSAAHRTWMPALRHLSLFADREIPEPPTLFDDYSTRASGAQTAQMRVAVDLFPAYDLKLPVTGDGILDKAAARMRTAMTEAQRAQWDAAFGPRNEAFAAQNLTGRALTRWKYQRYIKNYLRCVAGLDESVGRVRDFLDRSGLAENTIVIYTSDQGFFLGEHGWYDKRFIYEEALRTPLIVSWPGVTSPGSTCAALVQNIDLAPTLLDVAGLDEENEARKSMHGRSLVPLLRSDVGAIDAWRSDLYYHYLMKEPDGRTSHLVAKHYGIRTARYKLVHFYELDTWELYDLEADPHEVRNVFEDPEHAETVADLRKRLQALRKQYGDASR